MKKIAVIGVVSSLSMVPFAGASYAADQDPGLVPVAGRAALQPMGVPVGSFTLLPQIDLGVGYDTNITATNSNAKEDWMFIVNPEVTLRSDWTRHMLEFDAYFLSGSYASYSAGNYENYSVGGKTRIDVTSDFKLFAAARWSHLNELPGDDETDTGMNKPLGYDETLASVGFRKDFNRFWATADFRFRDRDFDRYIDGVPSNQEYRTGQTYTIDGRVGYEISPLTSVFVGASNIWYDMDNLNYDATEWRVIGGLQFEPSRLMQGEVFIGYGEWVSDNGFLDDVPRFTYGANLAWFVSPLFTMTFTASQEVYTSNYQYLTIDGSSVLTSNAGVRGDYELRRDIILSGWFNYQNQDYYDLPRNDDQYIYGAEVRYLINRYAALKLNYTYTDFDTNFNNINGAESYTRNVVLGTLTLAY